MPTNFSAKFNDELFPRIFGLVFPGSQTPPKKFHAQNSRPEVSAFFGESSRGNRTGATGLRASERKSASERVSERVSEREGFQRFLRGFERFLEVFRGFERFSEALRGFRVF